MTRKSSALRGYNRRWRVARRAYLDAHPSCVNMGKPGCTNTATCVDHIKDHKGNAARFWDRRNWQPMCHHCHSVKTAKTQLRPARPLRYDAHGIPMDEQHHWRVE